MSKLFSFKKTLTILSVVTLLLQGTSVHAATIPAIEKALMQSGIGRYSPLDLAGSSCSGTSITEASVSKLPLEVQPQVRALTDKLTEYQPFYENAAAAVNIPWQALAALHYRENGLSRQNPGGRVNGEGLFGFTSLNQANGSPLYPQGYADDAQFTEQLTNAAEFFVNKAKSAYGVELSTSSDFQAFKEAFIAYNRGVGYKNVPANVTTEGPGGTRIPGPWPPDVSPYVLNGYDEEHLFMKFPNSGTTYIGAGPHYGEPELSRGKTDSNLGAMTIMLAAGFAPGGSVSCRTGAGGLVFPLRTTQALIDSGGGSTVIWSKAPNAHLTPASWAPYYAHDIGASEGTEVVAVTSGIIRSVNQDSRQGSIWLEADDGTWYFYQHLGPSSTGVAVKENDSVEPGQLLGTVGPYAINAANGGNTPPHLHFSASTERITAMKRGCSQAACPNLDKLIDVTPQLIEAYELLDVE